MNDDKIFIQDFEGDSKKGLIFVDDDSDVIIEQDAPTSDTEVSSASASAGTPHPHPHKWRWIALSISSRSRLTVWIIRTRLPLPSTCFMRSAHLIQNFGS